MFPYLDLRLDGNSGTGRVGGGDPGATIPSFPWPGVRMSMRSVKNAPSAILTVV
jgi:hypothetical protein